MLILWVLFVDIDKSVGSGSRLRYCGSKASILAFKFLCSLLVRALLIILNFRNLTCSSTQYQELNKPKAWINYN